MHKVHYEVRVSGKVQGVWFRKYTKDKADALGLKGIVRNKSNGNVYIEIEGEKDGITDFLDWLYKGSPLSKVKDVQFVVGKLQEYTSFEIVN